MNASENTGFDKRVRTHRRRTGQTQQQLAEKLGVTRLTVVNWEKGAWPGKNLVPLVAELRTSEEVTTEVAAEISREFTYQLSLPFEEPITVSLKVGPKTSESLNVEVRFERKAG